MIRPLNWALRWLWSLTTVAICTVNDADVTVVPEMTKRPVTDEVRPTAVVDCPASTSETR